MTNSYEELKTYIKEELNKQITINNNILNALQEYQEKETKIFKSGSGSKSNITIEDINKLLIGYPNLNYDSEDIKVIVSVINKRGLNKLEVDRKLKDISNYKNNKGVSDLKLFTIKCINRYSDEKDKRKLKEYL